VTVVANDTTRRQPTPRARSARGEGGRVRDELIAAAAQLLTERGSADSISVAEIVRRVGVTAPMLYNHFPDKDALFVAVHTERMASFRSYMRNSGDGATSAMDALGRRGLAYVRYARTNPDTYVALFMTRNHGDVDPFDKTPLRDITAFDDLVDAQLVARVVWVQVHGRAAMLISMPSITDEFGYDRLVAQTMASVDAGLLLGTAASEPTSNKRPSRKRTTPKPSR
jgi:AcrR family transcriptional regulator